MRPNYKNIDVENRKMLCGFKMKSCRKPIKISELSPERIMIAKIFKKHIEKAILELGEGYIVDLQGRFDKTPIRIELEIVSQIGEIH